MSLFDLTPTLIILVNVFVAVVFGFLLYILYKLYKADFKREDEIIRSRAYKDANKMLEDARQRSMEILHETNAKSQQILIETDDLSEDTRGHLKSTIDNLSQEQMKRMEQISHEVMAEYMSTLEEESNKGVQSMRETSEGIEQAATRELEEFTDALHKETIESQKAVEDKLNAEYEETHNKVVKYQEEQMAKIDAQIYGILYDVTKEVLSEGIDLKTQEELVSKALEDAKRDHII